jgi:iron(III) transport system permease protein
MLIAWLERRLTSRQTYSTIGGRRQTPSIVQLGPFRWVVRVIVLAYLALASLLPLIALIVVTQPYGTSHPDLEAMTLPAARARAQSRSANDH